MPRLVQSVAFRSRILDRFVVDILIQTFLYYLTITILFFDTTSVVYQEIIIISTIASLIFRHSSRICSPRNYEREKGRRDILFHGHEYQRSALRRYMNTETPQEARIFFVFIAIFIFSFPAGRPSSPPSSFSFSFLSSILPWLAIL